MLHLPDNKGRFHLYSDTSKFATGSAFYQIQNRKLKLTPYGSKRLPEAARNYSITELKMCGLAINIASFVHLLKTVDLNAIVDLALTHIIKSKAELASTRLKRSYSFKLYYIKGKDAILSNLISRQIRDDSNLYEIIPVLFNMQSILQTRYYNFCEGNLGKYLVQMRSQMKSTSIKLPDIHGISKGLDLNIQREKQIMKPIAVTKTKDVSQIKPRLGQGRAHLRYKIKTQCPS